jgi:hypothetical protein
VLDGRYGMPGISGVAAWRQHGAAWGVGWGYFIFFFLFLLKGFNLLFSFLYFVFIIYYL